MESGGEVPFGALQKGTGDLRYSFWLCLWGGVKPWINHSSFLTMPVQQRQQEMIVDSSSPPL